jgi:predicted kinase
MIIDKINTYKNPFVLVFVGPPLSGKSTVIKEILVTNPDIEIISRDNILLSLHTSDDYSDAYNTVDQKLVDIKLNERFQDVSRSKKNAIVDMTNMTSKRRKHNLSYFKGYYKVAVIFPILEWSEYVNRNNNRKKEENKYIPEHVIKDMISSYQVIDKLEGFDDVTSP